MTNIAINGFGRIGRLVFRALVEQGHLGTTFNVVAVGDIVPADNLAYLLKYDSTQGRFQGTVESKKSSDSVDEDDVLVVNGQEIKWEMLESTGGNFAEPILPSRGLERWGDLTLVFTDCGNGTATLEGRDGSKVSQLVKLSGIAGTNCPPGGDRSDAALSGLHYDPGKDGEGYNLIVTSNGSLLYYYGFKRGGDRLWLASSLIREVLEPGVGVVTPVYEATRGTFDNPVHSSQSLVQWGTASITIIDCDQATIVLQGSDGTKTSNTVPLVGIIGLECTS